MYIIGEIENHIINSEFEFSVTVLNSKIIVFEDMNKDGMTFEFTYNINDRRLLIFKTWKDETCEEDEWISDTDLIHKTKFSDPTRKYLDSLSKLYNL